MLLDLIFGRFRCIVCKLRRQEKYLDIYITRKLTETGHVDMALYFCNDSDYCSKTAPKMLPPWGDHE